MNLINFTKKDLLLVVPFFLIIALLVFTHSMQQDINHDEHQYIAAAKVTADQGLLPYKDYRFIHMPYSVFINALVFKFTDHLLISSRLVNAISFFFILLILFTITFQSFPDQSRLIRFLSAASAVCLLLFNQVVKFTFGKAWTFDLPLLLSVIAFLILTYLSKIHVKRKLFIAGILLGLSIGIRLQFIFVAFVLFIYVIWANYKKNIFKPKEILYLIGGGFTALIPLLILILINFKGFFFDIYMFHSIVDIQYVDYGLSFLERFYAMLEALLSKSNFLIVSLAVIFIGATYLFELSKNKDATLKLQSFFFLLPALGFIAVGKVILFQYIYPLIVFSMFGIILGISGLKVNKLRSLLVLLVFALVSVALGSNFQLQETFEPAKWEANTFNRYSEEISKITGENAKVLTLSPGRVLESGNSQIYKEFVTTPFIWRSSHFIPADIKNNLNIISMDGLSSYLEASPPDAILVGFEPEEIELPLIKYASSNNYQKKKVLEGILFLRNN